MSSIKPLLGHSYMSPHFNSTSEYIPSANCQRVIKEWNLVQLTT